MEFDFLASLPSVMPELGLTFLALLVLGLDVGFFGISPLSESRKHFIPYVAAGGMFIIAILPLVWEPSNQLEWGGMIRHDVLSQVFKVMVILAGAITSLIAAEHSELGRKGEFYLVIIVATLGASLMSGAADLIMVFVALETTSIPLYILAAFRNKDLKSTESGMKYFLFGSFASAILLYGLSLLYGFSGHTNLMAIAQSLNAPGFDHVIPVLISMTFIVVGFGFKISAVPFHFWTPDVYEGAPTPVTAFVSVASKAASVALLVRFFSAVFPEVLIIDGQSIHDFWIQLVAVIAVISMTLGNVLALSQRNIKRLLAYSSIAQAGYTLIGVAAIQASSASDGIASVAFYMFMYTFTNLLAFAVIVIFAEATGSDDIADLAGLNRRNSWMALAMTIALLSLGGIPPAAGFFGKFFLFNAAVHANLEWLAIIGVLNAIVALYYYLVVIKVMYVDQNEDVDKPISLSLNATWLLGVVTIIVVILGVFPTQIFDWAREGAEAFITLL